MSVTRREFLVAVPAVGAAVASGSFDRRGPQSPGGWEAASPASPAATPASLGPAVVSFHLDQPYLDLTGTQKPYVPPSGMRSGASLAALSEEEVLSRFYGFI
jgi:hypothetical protein